MEWFNFGKYEVKFEVENIRIFPKDKDGNTRPVRISRSYIHMRSHWNGAEKLTSFKFYKHQRNYYWCEVNHPRLKSQPVWEIQRRIAKMLFDGNVELAKELTDRAEKMIRPEGEE